MFDTLKTAKRLSILKTNQVLPDYKRFLFKEIKENKSKIIGIYGPRGVGKTTLMLQILKDIQCPSKEAMYISLDHPVFSGVSLFDFIDEFSKRGGKFLIIDEIHRAVDFEKHLKSVYDFLDIKIIFSGSSALSLTNPDFIRRFSMFKLPLFSLREYIYMVTGISFKSYDLESILKDHEQISEDIITTLKNIKIIKLYEEYIQHGAYPFYFEDPTKFTDRLNSMINAVLYSDLALLHNIQAEKIVTLKKLLMTICVSKPLELSIEKLSKITGISKATLYKYIDYLDKAELAVHISNEAKRFKIVRKPDKLYLANPNLFNGLCLEHNVGTIRETFIVSMLRFGHSVYYHTKGDFLIDEKYVIEVGGEGKGFKQIRNVENAFLAIDGIELGHKNRIPLWLFGFLY